MGNISFKLRHQATRILKKGGNRKALNRVDTLI